MQGECPIAFRTGQGSDVGCRRRVNEDGLLVRPEIGLWAVADGMGGHAAGDVASTIVVQRLATLGRPTGIADAEARLFHRLMQADSMIRAHGAENGLGMIGATVAAMVVVGQDYACVWAGDSRVYLLRDQQLHALTRDHSEVVELLDAGLISAAEAETWPRRNVITRAIGVSGGDNCSVVRGELRDKDRILLCTDGLTTHLSDAEIALFCDGGTPEATAEALVLETLARGAHDNVTVIVFSCLSNPMPQGDLTEDPFAHRDDPS